MPRNTPIYPEMQGRTALITGGTSGIGLATAQAFAQQGVTTIIASRNEKTAAKALATLQKSGNVTWLPCDVANAASVQKLCATIQTRHVTLDYAFNNGGSGGRSAPVASMTETAWRATIDGFLTSVFLCLRQQIPLMTPGTGVIVNNASVDGLRGYPFPGGAAYAAAKHAVLGLTKSAALEHAAQGPRITAICPGWVDTPPVARYMRNPETARAILAQTPRGTLATPTEIAHSVLYLCSQAATPMIGSPLIIDGGYMA